MKAVIIDDEKNGRKALISLIKNYCPKIEIVGEAYNVESGIESIKRLQPDVVFLDIEMPDGTGLDLLSQLGSVEFEVIFVSADVTSVVKVINFSAIEYLLKPVNPELLKLTVQKLNKVDKSDLNKKYDAFLKNRNRLEWLVLHSSIGIHVVNVENIMYCSESKGFTDFYLKNNVTIRVSETLKEYSEALESLNFFRTNQKYLVNLKYVDRFVDSDSTYIDMQNGTK